MPRNGDWLVPDLKRPIETIPTRFAVSNEAISQSRGLLRRRVVPYPAKRKNAGHLCVAGVDTRTYGTYLGAVSFGRPLIYNG
jgi:hypothetical protein